MLSFKHIMNFSSCTGMYRDVLFQGCTGYFEVTVVRDTHKTEIFEVNVIFEIFELFTHTTCNFIPLFIVHLFDEEYYVQFTREI